MRIELKSLMWLTGDMRVGDKHLLIKIALKN